MANTPEVNFVEDRKSRRMIAVAVIAVAPTAKASFVYSYVQTRLMGQYNGK